MTIDRGQIGKIVLIVLLVMFLFLWVANFKAPSSQQSVKLEKVDEKVYQVKKPDISSVAIDKKTSTGKEDNIMVASGKIEIPSPIEFVGDKFRDPFEIPPAVKEKISERQVANISDKKAEVPIPVLTLKGIFWGTASPRAIINGKIVKKGDFIEGVEVLDITKEGVQLKFSTREFTLKTKGSNDK